MGMNKEELIEAINETLVTNNNKAITADALRNLLTDIVENAGNSTGGAITFHCTVENDALNPITTSEDQAHNVSQIEILKQLHAEGKPIPPMTINISSIGSSGNTEIDSTQQWGYMLTIIWSATGDTTIFPDNAIFPMIVSSVGFELMINGDGTLIIEQ